MPKEVATVLWGLVNTSCHLTLKMPLVMVVINARDCIVPSQVLPGISVSLQTVLVHLVQCPQLAFPPFPSATWIGSLLVNCLFSGLSTKPHLLGLANWSDIF